VDANLAIDASGGTGDLMPWDTFICPETWEFGPGDGTGGGPGGKNKDLPYCPHMDICPVLCGDNKLSPVEQCDGNLLGGKTCKDFGFTGGALKCSAVCTWDTSACTKCGDGTINPGEQCDGAKLGGKTCQSLGYAYGTLKCTNCMLNTSGCTNCGNGKVDPGEGCDGGDLNGKTCKSLGFAGGTLKCGSGCALDTSGCFKCGDGTINTGEQCDGSNLGGKTCSSLGYTSGTLKCSAACKLDASGCGNCGNNKLDAGEQCDGALLNGKTCKSMGFVGGTLGCYKTTCKYDTSACVGCGNGKLDAGEQCDGADLNGQSCVSLGWHTGTLKCSKTCQFDPSNCAKRVCGDGKVVSPEQCDGSNLNGKTCKSLGYSGGSLACYSNCALNKTGCYKCGDGKINPGEQCDKWNLGGKSCKSFGYWGGALKCYSNCVLNKSGCTNCGNGVVNPGEQCDGSNLNGKSCKSLGYWGGSLKCVGCKLSAKGCTNCGNGVLNSGEQCDGAALGGKTCKTYGYSGGKLGCYSSCVVNKSGCYKCGDGKINPGEQCDKWNLGGKSCKSFGYWGGALKCYSNCAFNKSACTNCGNNKVDAGEQCDGSNLNGNSCKSLGYWGGALKCSKCKLNSAGCTNCGNGVLNTGEQCDGAAFGGKTCKTYGFHSGTLKCVSGCKVSTAGCTRCGNGVINAGEQCDGTNLGGKSCKSLGFSGGTLACMPGCKLDKLGCYKTKTLKDDTFNDFRKGSPSESGAKLYVTAKGDVQLLDRLDLNQDGHLDLVLANRNDGSGSAINSYIYWGGGASGFSAAKKAELPTLGGTGASSADLNNDGHVDLVFANHAEVRKQGNTLIHLYKVNSYIYWGMTASGGGTGYSTTYRTEVPSLGASGNLVADLDRNGHLDLVLLNNFDGATNAVSAYIYWGSAAGITASNRTQLPTLGSPGAFPGPRAAVADLNKDGHLDLVFSSWSSGGNYKTNSFIYWGSATGFVASKRADLPTVGAAGCSVADLNGDGHLDVVFANHGDGTTNKVNSYIYWGSASGYSTASRTGLPTVGAAGSSVADLNGDGRLDIVFSNHQDGTVRKQNSYIYWGSASGYSAANRTGLPTVGASGNLVADFNGDGNLDIAFANQDDGSSWQINSYVYWGSSGGFSASNRTALPSAGASDVSSSVDPGARSSRGATQVFTSRVFDTGAASPIYETLSWSAKVPKKTQLRLQVRSAASKAALTGATWYGPSSAGGYYTVPATLNPTHKGHRYLQYRAQFSSDLGNTPALDSVTVKFH